MKPAIETWASSSVALPPATCHDCVPAAMRWPGGKSAAPALVDTCAAPCTRVHVSAGSKSCAAISAGPARGLSSRVMAWVIVIASPKPLVPVMETGLRPTASGTSGSAQLVAAGALPAAPFSGLVQLSSPTSTLLAVPATATKDADCANRVAEVAARLSVSLAVRVRV